MDALLFCKISHFHYTLTVFYSITHISQTTYINVNHKHLFLYNIFSQLEPTIVTEHKILKNKKSLKNKIRCKLEKDKNRFLNALIVHSLSCQKISTL